MNLLLLISVLFSNVICKTIPHADQIKIVSDGDVKIVVHNSSRIFVETKYSNSAPEKLQDYIKQRYKIETVVESDVTKIIISKPKTKLIYHGKEITEKISSTIYIPEDTVVK